MTKKLFVFFVLVVAAIAALVLYSGADSAGPAPSGEVQHSRRGEQISGTVGGPPIAAANPIGTQFKQSPENGGLSIPLTPMKVIGRSADFRATYDSFRHAAINQPEIAYQLEWVLRNCMSFVTGGRSKAEERLLRGSYPSEVQRQRKIMFDSLADKCRGFQDGAWLEKEAAAMGKAAEGSPQSRARAISSQSVKGDKAVLDAAARELLATGDPFVLLELAPYLATNSSVMSVVPGHEGAASRSIITNSVELAACDLGYPCDTILLPGMCIGSGVCGAGSFEAALQQSALTPMQFELVNKYRAALLRAALNKDFSSLGL